VFQFPESKTVDELTSTLEEVESMYREISADGVVEGLPP
jgi:hypothetical protein